MDGPFVNLSNIEREDCEHVDLVGKSMSRPGRCFENEYFGEGADRTWVVL